MLFLYYPKCSTCKRAKAWLDNHHLSYDSRDIILDNPKYAELEKWIKDSGVDVKRFFNTSGLKYKELGLKDKLSGLSLEEKIKLLSSDGMLVKRPLIIGDNITLVGFNEKEWEKALCKN